MRGWKEWMAMSVAIIMMTACGGGGASPLDTTAPVFTSPASVTVLEGQIDAITLVATDATTVTYSIGGGDAADFDIKSDTGVVTFKEAPNFESGEISYSFTATAIDVAGNESTQDVTIEIREDGIVHNGMVYGTVVSPYTGKIWLDRNLGALHVCKFHNDAACYGDLYQWGRNYDGHQKRNSATTEEQAKNIDKAGDKFIKDDGTHGYDWAEDADQSGRLRSKNWSKTNGDSACPVGFRVPTIAELKAELLNPGSSEIQNNADAFESFLKLPSSGYRSYNPDVTVIIHGGSLGGLWSSSASDDSRSYYLLFENDIADVHDIGHRASGLSVRCLKN